MFVGLLMCVGCVVIEVWVVVVLFFCVGGWLGCWD